jgi:hypothetical protein
MFSHGKAHTHFVRLVSSPSGPTSSIPYSRAWATRSHLLLDVRPRRQLLWLSTRWSNETCLQPGPAGPLDLLSFALGFA